VDNLLVRNVENIDAALLQVDVVPYVRTDVPTEVRYTLKNNGFYTIDTVVISWTDGIHTFSETLTGLDLHFGETYAAAFSNTFTATDAEEYPLTFTISSVGSHPDELTTNNSQSPHVSGVADLVPRRIVGEEATGTWCGWCPRGTVFMEKMHQLYPDLFIPIAVHNGSGNPMRNAEYEHAFSIFLNYPGSPSVLMDRKVLIDPRDMDSTIQVLLQTVTPVDINVHTTIDSLNRKLYIEGKITTYTSRTNAQYRLVLVLAENDVRGTSSGYWQNNYYAGGNEGPMGGFENLPGNVPASQMHYNFVGRKLLHGFYGLPGVVPATFQKNDEFSFSASEVFPATYDMDQLYVVAMVVDGENNVVLNAAMSTAVTSAVKEESKNLGAVHIYPNPASGTTYLDLQLTETAPVSIELLNPLGQTVRTQDPGRMPAGRSVLPLRVSGLAAGMYTVKMNVAGQVLLRTVVVE